MNKIIVFGEIKDGNITCSTLELVSKAWELKIYSNSNFSKDITVETVVISSNIDESIKHKIYSAGADKIVLIKNSSFDEYCQTIYSKVFVDYFSQNPADVILFPATQSVRAIAPRITTLLNTGLVADCTDLELIEKNGEIVLASTRPTFGGELMATILSKKNPQCATVRPATFKIKDTKHSGGEYFEYSAPYFEENRVKLLKSFLEDTAPSFSLADANIVLAGGYGIVSSNKKEYFEKLEKLAKMINGCVGCTRKVVDYGIMPSGSQIGITGLTIAPRLYIAFGISGAIQHTMGMKNSKTVIAINSNENAEIFKYADYKIVADAKKIIDELLDLLS